MYSAEITIYSPNKGMSYGQSPRKRGINKVWEDINNFLNTCTIVDPIYYFEIRAFYATEWDDDTTANRCVEMAKSEFGNPDKDTHEGGLNWSTGKILKGGICEWKKSIDEIDRVIKFLSMHEPWPKQTLGPVEIQLNYDFLWRGSFSNDEPNPIPHDNYRKIEIPKSNMLIIIGKKSFIQPAFWFPYSENDPTFIEFINRLNPFMPIKLLPRHFRAAIPVKNKSKFRFAKLKRNISLNY